MAKKILIAEDEPAILKMFTDMLHVAGFEVISAMDGEEALDKLNNTQYDLVLLDMQMPKKDGFAVLEAMQADGSLRRTKVVVLSNMDNPKWIKRARELGAHDYWLKVETHLTELIDKVKQLLA